MRKLDFGFRRDAEVGLGPVGEFVLELAGDGAVEHAPGPVAAQRGRGVDARLVAQVKQVLHGVDARVAHAGGDGSVERVGDGLAGLLMGVQGCLLALTRGSRSLKPAACRLVVVSAHVGDGVGNVVVRQVVRVGALKGKLQDLHAGEARVVAHIDDAGGEEAQVLGDDGQRAELFLERLEELEAGTLRPRTVGRIRRGERHLPIGLEAAEVIQADDVVHVEGGANAALPPGETVGFHGVPVVDGISPVLAGGRELVGRRAGDTYGITGGVDLKELGCGPHLDGVARDIDGQVADDEDVALVGIGLEAAPLTIEEVLRHLVVEHARGMGGADLGRSLTAGTELCGPLPKCLETALLLDGHELAVGDEPVFVGLDKLVEVGRLVGGKALGGAVENLTTATKDGAIVDIAGVGAQVHAVDIALLQVTCLDELGKVNEIGIARTGRERLIGRVAIARRRKGQNLPIMLFARGEEIDKVIGVPAKAADAIRSGQRRDGHENTACMLHGCTHRPFE